MNRNALRRELTALLRETGIPDPPAVKRARSADWLYAMNLDAIREKGGRESILAALSGAGWETAEEQGWLQLKKESPEPPEGWYEGTFGPEASCCRSLLARHEEGRTGDSSETQRRLIKAGEEGERALEETCGKLHREWAERLRRGEPLPDIHPDYFGQKDRRGKTDADSTHWSRGISDGNGERGPNCDGSL